MAEARRTFRGWMRVVVVLAAVACATVTARAQTQLPGITVTTPSPVTPSTAPAQAPAAAPQPAQPAADLAGTGLNEILAEFESHWLGGEVEGVQYRPAESAYFRDIVGGVVRERSNGTGWVIASVLRKVAGANYE